MGLKPVYNLNEIFAGSVEHFRDRIAIESRLGDRLDTLTYGQLGEEVKRLAYFISSSGIKKSDRVGIVLENRPEWAIIFFALGYIGAVGVPLDPHMSEKDVKNILSDSGARLVLVSGESQKIIEGLRDYITFIIVEEIKELKAPPDTFKSADIKPGDLIVLLYTSGTTDIPKGVMLTHKNLCANFYSLKQMKVFGPRDVLLSVLPLYHSYALMTTLIAPVFSGSMIIYVPSDWPEKLVEYIRTTNTSIFIGVPQIYQMMHSRMMKKLKETQGLAQLYVRLARGLGLARILLPKIRNAFGRKLRFFVTGGAKLDQAVARDFFKLGFKILEGYGLTETSPVASMNPPGRPRIGSIGRPIPDVKLKVVNRDVDGIGEIAIKGPNVMKGYYKNETKTKEVIKDGWFLSGDLGYVDGDGYFYITGRSKEVIVLSSGKNIYPEEIEKHYSQTPYIKEMCVLGVLKEKAGGKLEYLHAIVVPDLLFFKERGEMNIRMVIKNTLDNLSKNLPPYRHIMGFTVVQEALPRTVLGKLKRYEIEKRYMSVILDEKRRQRELTSEDEKLLKSNIAMKLIGSIRDVLGVEGPISLNDSIELDLGVDSLGRVELVLAIEKCFDIEFPEEMVAGEIFTVKDIILKVEELLERTHASTGAEAPGKEEKTVHWPEILRQPLPEEFQKKILLQPNWIDYILTFLVKGFINVFFRIFYNLEVKGRERLPKRGPYVLCVNHTSFLDGFIVAAGVPFRVGLDLFFIGFRRYFIYPIVRNFVRRARIIPIDATEIIEAMQGASFILTHDKALCIFPEGERSIDGEVKGFKKGIGIIAKELEIPLVPVYIKGAFDAWPRTERLPGLRPIGIRFGNPASPDALIQKGMALGAQDEYGAISLAIREELLKLTLH